MFSMFSKKKEKSAPKSISIQNSRTSEANIHISISANEDSNNSNKSGNSTSKNGSNAKAESNEKTKKVSNSKGARTSGVTSPSIADIVSITSPDAHVSSPQYHSHAPQSPQSKQEARTHNTRNMNRSLSLRMPLGGLSNKKIDYKMGDHVRLTDRRTGWIRFIGKLKSNSKTNTNNSGNETWYGIELDEEFDGKHSGLYDGHKYFDTSRPMSGIFVRYNLLKNKIENEINSNKQLTLSPQSRSGHGRKLSSMIYRTGDSRFGHNSRNNNNVFTPDIIPAATSMTVISDAPENYSINIESPQLASYGGTPQGDMTVGSTLGSPQSFAMITPQTQNNNESRKIRVSFVVPNYDRLLMSDGENDENDSDDGMLNSNTKLMANMSSLQSQQSNTIYLTEEEIAMREKTVTLRMNDEDVDLMNDMTLYSKANKHEMDVSGQLESINEASESGDSASGSEYSSNEEEEDDDDDNDDASSSNDGSNNGSENETDEIVQAKQDKAMMKQQMRGSVIVKGSASDDSDNEKTNNEKSKEKEKEREKEKEKENKLTRKMTPLDTLNTQNLGLFGLWDQSSNVTLTNSLVKDDSDLSSDDSDIVKSGELAKAIEMSAMDTDDNQSIKSPSHKSKKKTEKGKNEKEQKKKGKGKGKGKEKRKKRKNGKKKSKKKKENNGLTIKIGGSTQEVDKILGPARNYGIMTEEDLKKEKRKGKHEFKKISEREDRKMRKKFQKKDGKLKAIRIQIPIGDLNSVCMRKILSFLTIVDLAQWSICSKASRDCTRLVPKYDLRYLLRGYCSIQETRRVLSVLQYHKPQELIFPLAYFIYDPVILRLFLTYFNVDINGGNNNGHIQMGQEYYDSVAYAHQKKEMKRASGVSGNNTYGINSGKRRSTVDGSNKNNSNDISLQNRAQSNESDASDIAITRTQTDPMESYVDSKMKVKQPKQQVNLRPRSPQQQMFKYIHRIVIDDRDIRPSTWVMRPGNYPWCELGKNDSNDKFPIELVDCFHSLGNRLWSVDVRHTENIELAYFAPSQHSVQVLAVNAQNRYDCEHFSNLKELIIENPKITDDEIDRSDILDWKHCWMQLKTLHLVNQRFNCSKIDLFETISWLKNLENIYLCGSRFHETNDQKLNRDLVKEQGNVANKVCNFKIKHQKLSVLFVDLLLTLFPRISKLTMIECTIGKGLDWSFALQFSYLTRITIVDLKTKLRKKNSIFEYNKYLESIYKTLSVKLTNSPIVIESNARGNPVRIASHIKCKHCDVLVDKRYMDDHLNEMCLKRYIDCPLCGTSIFRGKLSHHWENKCINYRIICMLCGQTFATNERNEYKMHLSKHASSLDNENSKYELIFANHCQALTLKNEYGVYLVANCRNCNHRVIQASVSDKHIKKCIPLGCDVCDPENYSFYQISNEMRMGSNNNSKPSKNAQRVLPHPFAKSEKFGKFNGKKGNNGNNGDKEDNKDENDKNKNNDNNDNNEMMDDENDDLYKVYDSDDNNDDNNDNNKDTEHSYKHSSRI